MRERTRAAHERSRLIVGQVAGHHDARPRADPRQLLPDGGGAVALGAYDHQRCGRITERGGRPRQHERVLALGDSADADDVALRIKFEPCARRRHVGRRNIRVRATHPVGHDHEPAPRDSECARDPSSHPGGRHDDARRTAQLQGEAAPKRPTLRTRVPLRVLDREQIMHGDHLRRGGGNGGKRLQEVGHIAIAKCPLQMRSRAEAPPELGGRAWPGRHPVPDPARHPHGRTRLVRGGEHQIHLRTGGPRERRDQLPGITPDSRGTRIRRPVGKEADAQSGTAPRAARRAVQLSGHHGGLVTLGQNALAKAVLTSVLIDGYALSDGSQVRGVGTYLKRIIAGLGQEPGVTTSVLVESGVRLPPGVEPIALRPRLPRRFRALEHDLRLPRELARHPRGVFYSPAQQPPRRVGMPWVQTLHDLIPLTRPHPLLERDRRRWARIGPRLRGAAAVIAVSRFSAEEGIRHLGLDRRRVHVIPPGVDHGFFSPAEARGGDPYVLHVAAWGPHKGFSEAMEVAARLAEAGLPHRLRLVGPQDAWMRTNIERAIAASPRPERIEIAGYVDDLPTVYRGAAALLMTSRCEGFGLPALEAMACGTPVVAFANSSLPEVVGDGGILIPDGDTREMAAAVTRLIGSEELRHELSERGVARAATFRWEDTVRDHLDVLRAVAR
jgi:glycosyltransferase involved in cell wall biosynthesis